MEFCFLKINFESLVTYQVETDFLCCSPQFFRKAHYNFVLVHTVKGNIFAQLIFVFAIWIEKKPYPIALIQPYDAYLGPPEYRDEDLGLFCVGMKPRSKSEFISVLSIVCGAILVPSFEEGKENEFLVMDSLDGDMFLRVEAMRQK